MQFVVKRVLVVACVFMAVMSTTACARNQYLSQFLGDSDHIAGDYDCRTVVNKN